jgi:hypothetical protein
MIRSCSRSALILLGAAIVCKADSNIYPWTSNLVEANSMRSHFPDSLLNISQRERNVGVEEHGTILTEFLPKNWQQAVEKVIFMLDAWCTESNDVLHARDVITTLYHAARTLP